MAVPEFCSVTLCELEAPTSRLPKLKLAGETESKGCTPTPLREMTVGELVAVLAMLTLPATLPGDAGAKFTASERLCPAARLRVPVNPLTLNPVPAAETWETVTLPVPALVSVTACDAELPTRRFPNDTLPTLDESK